MTSISRDKAQVAGSRRALIILTLLVVVGAQVWAQGGRRPRPLPAARYIAFSSNRAGSYDVYLYDMSNSTLVTPPGLNSTSAQDVSPSISSDGRFIAFESDRGGPSTHVYFYDRNLNGGSLVNLPGVNTQQSEEHPSLSGDGSLLAFDSNRTGVHHIYLYDAASKSHPAYEPPGLNATKGEDINPCISLGGTYIVFQSNRAAPGTNNYDVYFYDRSAASPAAVALPNLNSQYFDGYPTISTDGRYICFMSRRAAGGTMAALYLYDRQNPAAPTQLLPSWTAEQVWPSFSRDNRYISFSSTRPGGQGGYDVYLYDCSNNGQITAPTNLNSTRDDSESCGR
jgi:Tol biopolymer transport system component